MSREHLIGDDEIDVEAAPAPSDDELKKVRDLARLQIQLTDEIAELEGELSRKRESLRSIREGSLPLAMTELGFEEFKLVGGGRVVIQDVIGGSISVERKPAAHEWFERNGHGALIKHTITIEFGKGEDAWAKKFIKDLEKRKKPLKFSRKDAVHAQTLGAFIREQIKKAKEQGADPRDVLPYETLGVFELRVADVKLPGAK